MTWKRMRITHDGSHYIGHEVYTVQRRQAAPVVPESYVTYAACFDTLYAEEMRQFAKKERFAEKQCRIRDHFFARFGKSDETATFVENAFKRKAAALHERKKRFARKAYLNQWDFFATVTYDSAKMDADTFRNSLKRTFNNLATRRGWRCMGVFEHGEKKDRLHFHCFLRVPEGQMVGQLFTDLQYSTKRHRREKIQRNTFFCMKFGNNEFAPLPKEDLRARMKYLLKYLTKTGEKIFYSRGIPTDTVADVREDVDYAKEVVISFAELVPRYVLFDSLFDLDEYRGYVGASDEEARALRQLLVGIDSRCR